MSDEGVVEAGSGTAAAHDADADRMELDGLVVAAGFPDFRWVDGSEIVVAHWVRMKCRIACEEYAHRVGCPPNVPSIEECAAFFRDYHQIAVIHIRRAGGEEAEMRDWKNESNAKLLGLERSVFLAGYHKAVVLFAGDCSLCPNCVSRPEDCRYPGTSRPTPDAVGVDVFATVRKLGYPIRVLTSRFDMMDRYAFLLVE